MPEKKELHKGGGVSVLTKVEKIGRGPVFNVLWKGEKLWGRGEGGQSFPIRAEKGREKGVICTSPSFVA